RGDPRALEPLGRDAGPTQHSASRISAPVGRMIDSRPPAHCRRTPADQEKADMTDWIDRRLKFVFLVPAMVALVALTAFPTVYMFVAAFVKFDASAPLNSKFVGLDNFLRLFTDDKFHNALINTAVFTTVAVTLEFVLGLGFALLVDT